jgi:hypothetical protein
MRGDKTAYFSQLARVSEFLDLSAKKPDREIAVIVPELVEHKWYHYALHNQRAQGLKALLLRGNQRIAAYSRALQLPSTYARCEPEKSEKTAGSRATHA